VEAFRRNGCTGLLTTQSNGQIGDSGRDQGHAAGELLHYSWIAEVAWKAAGVDLFAEANNRLRSAGEYFANYNNGGSPAFIKAGTCYNLFTTIGGDRVPTLTPTALHLLHGAYVVRKGQSMPLLSAYRDNQTDDWQSWVYRRATDNSTATTPLPGVVTVVPAAVTGGLTKTDINGALPAGAFSYSNGTWTVTAGGADLWGGNATDSFTFMNQQVTGDATMIARVTGLTSTNAAAKAGLVIRESLAGDSDMAMIVTYPGAGGLATSGRGATAYSHYSNTQNHANGTVPYWVKIERVGNRVTTYDSAEGTNWTPVKSYEFAMNGTYYIGLAVTSRVNGTAATATFTNVSLASGIANGTYRIRNRASGQYLDNLGKFTDGVDPVSQWTSSTSNNQKWTVTTADYSKIACVTGGKYLDSVNKTGNDTPVGQWSGSSSANQQWTIVNLGTGYYKIVNRANGYTLDTGGSTTATPMEFWAPGTSFNQQWQFVP
jgi:regulation of enolase protein 1 (concanavalin A-like superfamily)